jgi:hypothetical protein
MPRCYRTLDISHLSEPGGPDGTLYRIAAACLQRPDSCRSGRPGLHVGNGIAIRRCIDQRTGGLFLETISYAGSKRQRGAHRAREAAIYRRGPDSADSAVRVLSWGKSGGQRPLSAPCGATCPLSTQATARDSKRPSHSSSDARCNQGFHQRSDASRRCVSRIDLTSVLCGRRGDVEHIGQARPPSRCQQSILPAARRHAQLAALRVAAIQARIAAVHHDDGGGAALRAELGALGEMRL